MAGVWISFCNSHLSVKHLYDLLFSFCEIYSVNSVFFVLYEPRLPGRLLVGPRVRWWVVTKCSVFRPDFIVCVSVV